MTLLEASQRWPRTEIRCGVLGSVHVITVAEIIFAHMCIFWNNSFFSSFVVTYIMPAKQCCTWMLQAQARFTLNSKCTHVTLTHRVDLYRAAEHLESYIQLQSIWGVPLAWLAWTVASCSSGPQAGGNFSFKPGETLVSSRGFQIDCNRI